MIVGAQENMSLAQAVTLMALGKMRSAAALHRLMKRHKGQRRPVDLWEKLSASSARIVDALRRGDLVAWGYSGNVRTKIPLEYLMGPVVAEPVNDTLHPQWELSLGSDHVFAELSGMLSYTGVVLLRSDVVKSLSNDLVWSAPVPVKVSAHHRALELLRQGFVTRRHGASAALAKKMNEEHAFKTYAQSTLEKYARTAVVEWFSEKGSVRSR